MNISYMRKTSRFFQLILLRSVLALFWYYFYSKIFPLFSSCFNHYFLCMLSCCCVSSAHSTFFFMKRKPNVVHDSRLYLILFLAAFVFFQKIISSLALPLIGEMNGSFVSVRFFCRIFSILIGLSFERRRIKADFSGENQKIAANIFWDSLRLYFWSSIYFFLLFSIFTHLELSLCGTANSFSSDFGIFRFSSSRTEQKNWQGFLLRS